MCQRLNTESLTGTITLTGSEAMSPCQGMRKLGRNLGVRLFDSVKTTIKGPIVLASEITGVRILEELVQSRRARRHCVVGSDDTDRV